jgi:hypothetical protein
MSETAIGLNLKIEEKLSQRRLSMTRMVTNLRGNSGSVNHCGSRKLGFDLSSQVPKL